MYLLIGAVLGSSQSSQTITTLTPVPARESHTPQTRSSNRTHLSLCSHHCHIVSVCPGNALPGWPRWQERFLSTAWLGTQQSVNSGTEPRTLLFWKWVVTHFAAYPRLGCFYCFPNYQFYCKSQITKAQQTLLPGWKCEQGLEARTEQETQRECVCSQSCQSAAALPSWSISAMPASLLSPPELPTGLNRVVTLWGGQM